MDSFRGSWWIAARAAFAALIACGLLAQGAAAQGPGPPPPPPPGGGAPPPPPPPPPPSQPPPHFSKPPPPPPPPPPPQHDGGNGQRSSAPAGVTSPQSGPPASGESTGSEQATSSGGDGSGAAPAAGGGKNSGSGRAEPATPLDPRSSEAPLTGFVTSVPDQLKFALALAVALAIGAGLALLRERRRCRDARETALRDPLTRMANRVAFDQQLAIEWERFQRHGRPFGILALDLDRLKEVNDEHGHSAGDRILREAAGAIQGRIRRSDFAARLGGDEFCVIVPELGEQGLRALAAMLREAVDAKGIPVSVGWALAGADEGPIQLLDRADAAMYEDKRYRSSRSEPSVNVLRPAPPSTVTS